MDVKARFMRHILEGNWEHGTGCWEWGASRASKGYGWFRLYKDQNVMGAHRAAWLIFRGEIPPGLGVLHSCDYPPCVNPAHLFLGTVQDNSDDMVSKGRSARGERSGKAKLTVDQVRLIRENPEGKTQRALGAELKISEHQVWYIASGRAWKHL